MLETFSTIVVAILSYVAAIVVLYPPATWMVFGVILLFIRTRSDSASLFLIGLASVTLGSLMWDRIISAPTITFQIFWLFIFTLWWSAVLWVPITMRKRKIALLKAQVGKEARVSGGSLDKTKIGNISVDGQTFPAHLLPDSAIQHVDNGERVRIIGRDQLSLIVEAVGIAVPNANQLQSYQEEIGDVEQV